MDNLATEPFRAEQPEATRVTDLVGFLFQIVLISLSGVIAPGPITAATLTAGIRRRHAGALVALGHCIVEFPLMLLIVAGMDVALRPPGVQTGIGLAGGVALVFMGAQLLRGLKQVHSVAEEAAHRNPLWTGIVLTGANPYFLLWWATVGLALSTQASQLGPLAFVLFALTHSLCDLLWLEALSQTSHRGAQLLTCRGQRIVDTVCGAVLLGFGASFLHDAGKGLLGFS